MKKIALLLSVLLIISALFCFTACNGEQTPSFTWAERMETIRTSIVEGRIATDQSLDVYSQNSQYVVSKCYATSANDTQAVFNINYYERNSTAKVIGDLIWSNETNTLSFEGRFLVRNSLVTELTVTGIDIEGCFSGGNFYLDEIPASQVTFETQINNEADCIDIVADAIEECFSGLYEIIGS